MVELETQLRAYSTWLVDQADERAADLPTPGVDAPGAETPRTTSGTSGRPGGRRWAPILAVAAVSLLVVGLLAAAIVRDPEAPEETPPLQTEPTTPSSSTTTTSTTVPTETEAAPAAGGWTGGLVDDLDLAAVAPLDEYTDGDVVIPSAPAGWRVDAAGWSSDDPETRVWSLDVIEAPADNGLGHHLYLRMTPEPRCDNTLGCVPSGRTVTVGGVIWEEIVVENVPDDPDFVDMTTLRAPLGDRWLSLAAGAPQALDGPLIENAPIIEFLEGLGVGSIETLEAIGEACFGCPAADVTGEVVGGAEGDPFSDGLPPTEATEATEPTTTTAPDAAPFGRPLTELQPGDIVVATYVPLGYDAFSSADRYAIGSATDSTVTYTGPGSVEQIAIRTWEYDQPAGELRDAELGDPNHPPVDLAGLTWGWSDFESARVANVGEFSVWLYLRGLGPGEAVRFVEGLRAVSLDEFDGSIIIDGPDGLTVGDPADPSEAVAVAASDDFQVTALRAGDEICTKFEDLRDPPMLSAAGNCVPAARLSGSAIVEFFPLDTVDVRHVILGVVDDRDAEAVSVTAPAGDTAIVATGPVTEVVGGRFFLVELDLDTSDGIRLDRFVIESVAE